MDNLANSHHLIDNSYYYGSMWSIWNTRRQGKNSYGVICNKLYRCLMLSKVSFKIYKAKSSFGQFDYSDQAITIRKTTEIRICKWVVDQNIYNLDQISWNLQRFISIINLYNLMQDQRRNIQRYMQIYVFICIYRS